MPRRVYTYQPEMGWDGLNLLASAGSVVLAASFAVLLWNGISSLRRGSAGRRQSVGCRDAGMGDSVAAAVLQLRPHSAGHPPRTALGGARRLAGRLRAAGRQPRTGRSPASRQPRPDLREATPEPSIWPLICGAGRRRRLPRLDLHAVGDRLGHAADRRWP